MSGLIVSILRQLRKFLVLDAKIRPQMGQKGENRVHQIIKILEQLLNIDLDKCESTLGLFSPNHIDYISQRPENQPGLAQMTSRALDKLGLYFLMIKFISYNCKIN